MTPEENITNPLEKSKNPVKVLLVDDKEKNLISLEALLKKKEEDILYILCQTGEEALKISIKEDIALILMDVQMPGMSGYDVARFLKNNSRTENIPIVFVTALDQDSSNVLEGFEVGAVDYLFKPLNPVITKSKVNAFIRLHRQKKELEVSLLEKEKAEKELNKANIELTDTHKSLQILNSELEEKVKERTKDLENSNKDLKRINSDLDNFIYTASHDLKAPINNIEGLVSNLTEEIPKDAGDCHAMIEMINHSIIRFKNTLLDLTDIAKIQHDSLADTFDLKFEDISALVKADINVLIREANARITEDYSKAPSISFSRKNLRSIVYNLLSNAVKYRSPDRRSVVDVETFHQEEFTVLSVKDNGLGIMEEDKEKVFSMFKRLHDHVEGSGIGMSLVKKIMDNAGGKIEIESEVGKGTTFMVYFPL